MLKFVRVDASPTNNDAGLVSFRDEAPRKIAHMDLGTAQVISTSYDVADFQTALWVGLRSRKKVNQAGA
jgi:hypothetical protein